MPVFDFMCEKCKHEELNKLAKPSEPVKCSLCGKCMNKKISAPNLGGFNSLGQSEKGAKSGG
ncbi:hypothetical protein [uncultured Mediterranean phage uvMED]|nr:hypothetical protein [uncultured Mediterranean phage uvMED]BAR22591.1 putative regulatory protein, FmdB family (TIGR02605) [uncultured Mediterranean phage uvMED]